jgi:hypothetical protein
MPYIKPEQRVDIDVIVEHLSHFIKDAGTMNYAVSRLSHLYLKDKGLRYANLNELIGALECIKQELYRKIAAPYEDEKIFENGVVGVLPIELHMDVRKIIDGKLTGTTTY